MLVETDLYTYRKTFPVDPHPFISDNFIELNRLKVDRIVRLLRKDVKHVIGLIAGIQDNKLKSPFSAPFGGFHFRNEIIYSNEIDGFLAELTEYAESAGLERIELTLPPDLYNPTFNAKIINSLIRNGYSCHVPDITNWVDLRLFSGEFSQKNSREYYRQGVRNGLTFIKTEEEEDKSEIYNLIAENRQKFGRPIFMTLSDLLLIESIWPVDYFKVLSHGTRNVAAAIFYRSLRDICHAVFWGDNEEGRPLRAMDFMVLNLWSYYKNEGYTCIDLGISTEYGVPNEGLLRFKESHEAVSSLRYRFYLDLVL